MPHPHMHPVIVRDYMTVCIYEVTLALIHESLLLEGSYVDAGPSRRLSTKPDDDIHIHTHT